ncbi:cathepsin S, ortholog 1 [Genypterus blacodes]|uniref:cathepsin S, ortholog 1 n=1 Tax=Genypterus blacodes TaxID=154954 RepID=UPI003F777263
MFLRLFPMADMSYRFAETGSDKMSFLSVALLSTFLVLGQSSSALDEEWEEWKIKYHKVYNNQTELVYRRAVWEKNMKRVLRHNQGASGGQHSFTLGINELSDMSAEEVNEKMNGLKMDEPIHFQNWTLKQMSRLPESVNWMERGLVSPVRNQGPCGSCWAFSAVGALEGQMKKRTGVLVPLSPQNLVDCSVKEGNHGCRGGNMGKAFRYVIANEGIDSESFYPYKHKDGICVYDAKGKAGYCSGYKYLPRGNEMSLQAAIATVGPVATAVNANLPSFHLYKRGVYDTPKCDPRRLNHAVLIVGYGADRGKDFWLVKNSWGTSWGEGGFIRIARNKRNMCGIATFPVYPTL